MPQQQSQGAYRVVNLALGVSRDLDSDPYSKERLHSVVTERLRDAATPS